jgi:nucleoside diphosphate kinase
MEQTYIMIKPDGVQRGLVAEIIKRFEQKGFALKGLKMQNVTKEHAERHYADLSSKCAMIPFCISWRKISHVKILIVRVVENGWRTGASSIATQRCTTGRDPSTSRPDSTQSRRHPRWLNVAGANDAHAVCRPFFPPLVEYMCSGPVIAMVWEGKGVVATGRKIIGANPVPSLWKSIDLKEAQAASEHVSCKQLIRQH